MCILANGPSCSKTQAGKFLPTTRDSILPGEGLHRIWLVCSLMVPLMGHLHYLLTAEGLRTIGLVVYARNQLDTQLAHLPYRSRGGPRHRWTNLPASASGALTPCQWAARAATHTRSNRHRLVPDVIYPPTTYTTTCPTVMEVRRARPRCS